MQTDDPNSPPSKSASESSRADQSSSAHSDLIKLREDLGRPPSRVWTTAARAGAFFAGLFAIERTALGVYGIVTGRTPNYGFLKNSGKLVMSEFDKSTGRKLGLGNLAIGLGLGAVSVGVSASTETAVRARNLLRLYDELSAKENQPGTAR